MPASVVHRENDEKPDGSRYEMVAWQVPVSDAFPEGLTNSFQYTNADGDTHLRFDNAPDHEDVGRHHRHTPDVDLEAEDYTDLPDLIARFQNEVPERYDRRTN